MRWRGDRGASSTFDALGWANLEFLLLRSSKVGDVEPTRLGAASFFSWAGFCLGSVRRQRRTDPACTVCAAAVQSIVQYKHKGEASAVLATRFQGKGESSRCMRVADRVHPLLRFWEKAVFFATMHVTKCFVCLHPFIPRHLSPFNGLRHRASSRPLDR